MVNHGTVVKFHDSSQFLVLIFVVEMYSAVLKSVLCGCPHQSPRCLPLGCCPALLLVWPVRNRTPPATPSCGAARACAAPPPPVCGGFEME